MAWVKLDDRVWSHRKFAKLSAEATRLWMFGLCWANSHGTDGEIPLDVLAMLRGTVRVANELVSAELWHQNDSGWSIHDYLDYQPGRDREDTHKQSNRERVQRHRSRRNANVTHYSVTPVTPCNSPPSRPVPARPDPSRDIIGDAAAVPVEPPIPEPEPVPPPTKVPKPPKEPKPPKPKAERFVPDSFEPSEAHRAKAKELGVSVDRELQSFRCHEFKIPKSDWNKAFHGWLLRASQFGTSSGGRSMGSKLDTPAVMAAEAEFRSMLFDDDRNLGEQEPVKAMVVR